MEFKAYAMSADFTDHTVIVFLGVTVYCVTYIAKKAPGTHLFQSQLCAFISCLYQVRVLPEEHFQCRTYGTNLNNIRRRSWKHLH